jgi:hypothetical protein
MARSTAEVAIVLAVVAATTTGAALASEPAPAAVVVLHVTDYQHVPAGELAAAERAASRVYARIGVRLVWTNGVARLAAPDGALHVDVVILDAEMANADQGDPLALGFASHVTRRAKIYFARVRAYARETGGSLERVFGLVLAHEIGHVLLPNHSHSSSGVMRASWDGRIARLPGFTRSQAETIRTRLIAAR